jgi:hypothetical protein
MRGPTMSALRLAQLVAPGREQFRWTSSRQQASAILSCSPILQPRPRWARLVPAYIACSADNRRSCRCPPSLHSDRQDRDSLGLPAFRK